MKISRLLIIVLMTLLIGHESVSHAQAPSVMTVTNLNDSGTGSLRDAVANIAAGGTINFAAALTGVISLQSVITVDKDLAINGPGYNAITIECAGFYRAFYISSSVVASINNVTIDRSSSANFGGG